MAIGTSDGEHYESDFHYYLGMPMGDLKGKSGIEPETLGHDTGVEPVIPEHEDPIKDLLTPSKPSPPGAKGYAGGEGLDKRIQPPLPIIPPDIGIGIAPPTTYPQGGYEGGFWKGPLQPGKPGQRLGSDETPDEAPRGIKLASLGNPDLVYMKSDLARDEDTPVINETVKKGGLNLDIRNTIVENYLADLKENPVNEVYKKIEERYLREKEEEGRGEEVPISNWFSSEQVPEINENLRHVQSVLKREEPIDIDKFIAGLLSAEPLLLPAKGLGNLLRLLGVLPPLIPPEKQRPKQESKDLKT